MKDFFGVLILKVKRLNNDAVLPHYAHPGVDAGLDLCSNEEAIIPAGSSKLIGTGISLELPPSTEAQIRPRSGLALNHQVTVLNSPGTIDCGYRGEIAVILINHSKTDFHITRGMKIAQMVIQPVHQVEVEETNELSDSPRGGHGFGSSGV